MKTKLSTLSAGRRRTLQASFALTLLLAVAALAVPRSADAGVVVRARVGDVAVTYRNGDRGDRVTVAARTAPLRPVARRVLTATTPVAACGQAPACCDRRGGDHRGLVWVPGHWEKKGRAHGMAHAIRHDVKGKPACLKKDHGRRDHRGRDRGRDRDRDRKDLVWIPGHWCHG